MAKPIISVENLSKSYRLGQKEDAHSSFRDALANAAKAPFRRFRELSGYGNEEDLFWALKDVSFEVNPGEVVGIIGRNGAGKSTLLKILSRITEPSGGRAVLRGRVASLLEVGTGFHPDLTGRENIYLNGSILGMKKTEIDRKFDEIVAFAEVEKFLDTPVKRYSSGMYVRLAFAVAAHLEPEILIVDEVLAVGDAEFQKKCLGKMQEVAEGKGRTVLFVSHNLSAIRTLSNRAIYMKYGAMNSIGPVEEIATQYCQEQQRDATSRHIEFAQPMHHQKFVLRAATVVDLESQPSDRAQPLRSGSPLAIRVFFDAHESMQCIELQVELRDTQGTLVASFHTFLTEDAPAVGKGKYSWTCEIRELWLAEGDYFVSITAKDMCKTCDDKPSCLKFTIEGSRFNRFTRSVGQKYGTLCVPQTWQLDPIASNI